MPLSALPQDGDALGPVTVGTLGPLTVGTVGIGSVGTANGANKTPRVVPEEFAGYRRVRQLGIGGMGEVHLAHHQRLNRHVALKLLRPNVSDDQDFNARFLREAKAMAAVNHVNVVAIHDAGEVDGFLFMAIEYVEGTDVGKLLKTRGILDEATALKIMIGCCRGLEAIHAAGLVHRDIKPANIFLDRQGEPKIGDLGLARHVDGDDRMTMTGSAWGTPAYMPPEQLRGVADIDIRCDLYALGATLFTVLTGSEPFTGQTAFVVTTRILTEAAPDPRALNRTVSPALAAIIRTCLEKDRDKRYPTPTALRIDLERARDHLPLAFASLSNSPVGEAAAPIIGATARRAPSPAAAAGGSLQVNATLVKFLVYGTAVGLLALVIWSLRGGTTAMVQKLPILLPETDTTPLLKPSQPWMQVEDRDGLGAWARIVVNKVPMRLRHLPAGTFRMGSPLNESGRLASETPHQVTLSTSFWICETEVTRDLWAEVMGNGAPAPAPAPGTEPVANVSWHDAHDFLNALGERLPGLHAQLPTEAQWEYACRAGSSEAFAGGPHADPGEAISVKTMRNVASGKPNRFGLFDLHGNVREWCLDNWDGLEALPELADSDPLSRFGTLSVVRGGAWDAGEDAARSAARIAVDPQQRMIDIGFRFVVEDPPEVRP